MPLERRLLAALLGLYLVWSISVVEQIGLLYLMLSLFVFVSVGYVATRVGGAVHAHPLEPLLVWMVTSLPLLLLAPRGPVGYATSLGAIPVTQLIWAHLRYYGRFTCARWNPPSLSQSMFIGAASGFGLGVFFSLIAGAVILLREAPLDDISYSALVAAYFAGGIAAGLLVGLLRLIARWPLGVAALGFVGAFCLYAAVGIGMDGLDGDTIGTGLGIALIIGPTLGVGGRLQLSGGSGQPA